MEEEGEARAVSQVKHGQSAREKHTVSCLCPTAKYEAGASR